MRYVALLRGINIGGRNKIVMAQLVLAMERAGFSDVSTYINSGNVFFADSRPPATITPELEKLIEAEFGMRIRVLLRDKDDIGRLAAALPDDWQHDDESRCDIMFLWPEYDNENIFDHLTVRDGIDEVRYVPGALIWRARREGLTRSGTMLLPGTDVYAHMTVRNSNTVRQIVKRL